MTDPLLQLARSFAEAAPPQPDLVETPINPAPVICFDQLLDALVEKRWFVAEHYLPEALCTDLLADLQQLHQAAQLSPAGVGRGQEHLLNENIRGDYTHWLDGSTPAQQAYLAIMRELKDTLNRELFLGLFEYECHYAFYPPGAFYQKHLDSFRGRSNRKVTTVLYLNPDWQPADAGEMRVYHPDTGLPLLDVPPRSGTLVCFLSEEIPHEALPTTANRASIAGWFRCNASLNGRIDPAL
ncbi:2OG-Fe(II) oxygenase [Marinospirillum alkaliphilum]|uniref:SM-20-related protein n=1 Tax=Marinospirillum alkaliphilum DSM 21637 TaxID=1122209 RepID=A0A1K1VWC0_9GAMM|nr:2OG-Fe(II) oxygenase [Marinospirillum alkaliphilum]SFX29513.1 SM-20-related protein [Marinospirillum alkaliphilum DSM 21637]